MTLSVAVHPLTRLALAVIYIGYLTVLVSSLLYFYLSIYLLPADHATPPQDPPPDVKQRRTIYECADDEGSVARCWRGACKGSWKGARVRHCSVGAPFFRSGLSVPSSLNTLGLRLQICDRCRVGFDHHCPWFATCIAGPTSLYPFLIFLLLVPLVVAPCTYPILRPLFSRVPVVWRAARVGGGTVDRMWFSWGWSWVLGVGPVGRAMVGLSIGYWIGQEGERKPWEGGWLLVTVLVAWVVGVIAIVSARNL